MGPLGLRRVFWTLCGLGTGTSLTACLPNDTRPVPATMNVTVTGDAPLLGGSRTTTTADGWTLGYDRFLLSIGNAGFVETSSCADYYEAGYRRVLDPTLPGSQKLSVVYALGHCDFGFRVAGPDTNAVLGQGVSSAELAFMGTPGSDPYSTNRGISVYAQGSATKNGVTKTFAWAFRQAIVYSRCADTDGGSGLDLGSGQTVGVDLRVRGESLFLDHVETSRATLRFDPIASADDRYGNGDGMVALSELGAVPLSTISVGGSYSEPNATGAAPTGDAGDAGDAGHAGEAGDAATTGWKSLEDFIYLGLLPSVVRFLDTGTCQVRTGDFRWR